MTPVLEAKGARIPLAGLGTWDLRGRTCARVVEQALRLGYRHIDTAEMYDNEREVGEGLRASGVARGEVFVVTKVWPSHFAPRELLRAAKESLARLRMSEVDLLLLHWPNPQLPLSETLGALCQARDAGMARHIGVANFNSAMVEEATALATHPLVCNQFEMHPFLDQSKLVATCREKGMAVVAYSPIARGKAKNDATLARIGQAHGKTATQVCLRYLVQQNVAVIPRTSKLERLEENLAIFDFVLADAEMKGIAALASRHGRVVDWSLFGIAKVGLMPMESTTVPALTGVMLSSDDEARLVQEFFGGRTGYFVEVGANNPEVWSQTFHLEQLGWNGVLIEPQPDLADALRRTRKAQVFAVACSAPENSGGCMPLKLAGPSGIFSSLNAQLPTATARVAGTINVQIRTLDQILIEAHAPAPIDFLSIDVEGHELEVMRGFDFERWRPRLILIEDIVLDRGVHEFLTALGYAWMRRTGINAWYVPTSEAPHIGLVGRLQFFRKYYLGVPLRRLRQALRRLRTRVGLAGD